MPISPSRPQPPQHTTSLPSSSAVPPSFYPEASPARATADSRPATALDQAASRPPLIRPATTGDTRRPSSVRSIESSTGSDLLLGLGSEDGSRPNKAVRFGDGAKANRTATQSMADFLRNVPPPEVASPTPSATSAPEKTRKTSGRLFGLGRLGQKDADEQQRTPSLAPPASMTGLQKVVTPSGQTVHIIIPRPSPGPSFSATPVRNATQHTSSGASQISSEASPTASEELNGPPVLPRLRPFTDDEQNHDQRDQGGSFQTEERASADTLSQACPTWLSQASKMSAKASAAKQYGQAPATALLSPPSFDQTQAQSRSASAASSLASAIPQIVIPSSAAGRQITKAALEREALTLELLGQRIQRDAQGELVLSRRVSKRTVGAQTNISAVRSLLELSRERTTTNRSTRSTESGASACIPPSPAPNRGKTLATPPPTSPARDAVVAASAAIRKRDPSIEPDASLVGGESDDDQTHSVTSSVGTFGPRSPGASSTASGSGASIPTRPTPPPLLSSGSRTSTSSAASGSSWSLNTPSSMPAFGSLSAPQSLKAGGMRKATSGSRLRPSTAPTAGFPSPDAREREALEGRLKAVEERLTHETERRREAERRLKRLQVSTREGRARWEDMAGWAVEVIESADKDRHLLGLENARLQRTLELYRAQFGDYDLTPSSEQASD